MRPIEETNTPATDLTAPPLNLTPRELETARYLALGWTCKEIAAALGISVKTIDTHRAHVLQKLKLRLNADIARWGMVHGVIIVEPNAQPMLASMVTISITRDPNARRAPRNGTEDES